MQHLCFEKFPVFQTHPSRKDRAKEMDSIRQICKWLHIPIVTPDISRAYVMESNVGQQKLQFSRNIRYQCILGKGKHGIAALYYDQNYDLYIAVKFSDNRSSPTNNTMFDEFHLGLEFQKLNLVNRFFQLYEGDQTTWSCIAQEAYELSLFQFLQCILTTKTRDTSEDQLWIRQELSSILQNMSTASLTHGDFHCQNIRVHWTRRGKRCFRLIDFGKSTNRMCFEKLDKFQLLYSMLMQWKDSIKQKTTTTEDIPNFINFFNQLLDDVGGCYPLTYLDPNEIYDRASFLKQAESWNTRKSGSAKYELTKLYHQYYKTVHKQSQNDQTLGGFADLNETGWSKPRQTQPSESVSSINIVEPWDYVNGQLIRRNQ